MSSENIIVCCRCRPFNEKEKAAGHSKISEIDTKAGSIKLKSPKAENDVKTFTFDALFDETSAQMEVYNSTARIIVDAVLNGFNGTVFVYGQTGTGKTFSMQGIPNNPSLRGIIPNSFHHIFDHIARTQHKKFLVRVSFLEIYNEEIKDLLVKGSKNGNAKSASGLDLKEHPDTGVYVKDLSTFVVKSVEEMDLLMETGNKNRSVGATLMNEQSSRSHSIFTITIESSEPGPDGEDHYVVGKLNLVDLAGSERQSKTGATGDRLKEATKINLSLSALGNCISALVDGKSSHIPYRDSKLTRLLQDSLGGNAKTLMIATLSPASYNYDETLSTLRYANRAKNIKNKPIKNEDPKDAMLREYQEEIMRLRSVLEARQKGEGPKVVTKVVKRQVKKKIQKIVKKKQVPIETSGRAVDESGIAEADIQDEEEEEGEEEEHEASDDEPEEDEEEVVNPLAELDPETIVKLQAEVEAEKKALLASKDIVVEEKQRIAAELEQRAADLERERQEREALATKLKAMEAKLLVGGVHIMEKVNEQQKELKQAQDRLLQQQKRARELEQILEAKQEAQSQLEESYASLQEEVDVKTKKLKKLWTKFEEVKAEISDVKDEFRIEREDLLDTVRELSRELSFKMTVIDNFIPREEKTKIEKRAHYNEEKDDWELESLSRHVLGSRLKRPVSIPTTKRPVSQYAKLVMAMGDQNPRYRLDNIITLQLDLPERTTLQNEAPRKGGQEISVLQGALELAMHEDETDQEVYLSSDVLNVLKASSATLHNKMALSSANSLSAGNRLSTTTAPATMLSQQQYPNSKAAMNKGRYA